MIRPTESRSEWPTITVAESLRGCHPLVSATNQRLQAVPTDKEGYPEVPKDIELDVRVSRKSLHRALLIMDAILKACEARRYVVENGPTVRILGTAVRFRMAEGLETKREAIEDDDLNGRYRFRYDRFNAKKVAAPLGSADPYKPGECDPHAGSQRTDERNVRMIRLAGANRGANARRSSNRRRISFPFSRTSDMIEPMSPMDSFPASVPYPP